jgi:hypothetical protein
VLIAALAAVLALLINRDLPVRGFPSSAFSQIVDGRTKCHLVSAANAAN